MTIVRRLIATTAAMTLLTAGIVLTTSSATAAPAQTSADAVCLVLNDPVYQRVKPSNEASLLTPWAKEANSSAAHGFTQDDGTLFQASTKDAAGLVPVHRLYRGSNLDFFASADPAEWAVATADRYVDQGVSFYASDSPASCLVPVYRFTKSGKHRFAVSAQARQGLVDDGWKEEAVAFYAAPADATAPAPGGAPPPRPPPAPGAARAPAPTNDPIFDFAVYPDTQQEVGTDGRFLNRATWLLKQRDLDLRFVTHTGDVVNWDTPTHSQYEVASKAMKPFEEAGIPYSLAIGNHDTQATGVGGAARDPKNTRKLQRDTTTFNDYFTAARYGGVTGAFEPGKVDNVYSIYEAGGVKWMVLVLELWPRQSAVDWAKQQVAAHPDANVIVATHDYLDPDGAIEQSAQYGDTSPQSLYDQLISQYSNIRMVLSGHVGFAASRVDTGKNGNKIYSFMTTIHSGTSNPIRLFEVDTADDTLKTWIYAPWTDTSWPEYNQTLHVDWVR